MPDEFWSYLDEKLRDLNWSDRRLAAEAKLSNSIMSRARTGAQALGWDACVAIARALHIPETTLLSLAGLLDKPGKASPLRDEWNHLFDKLSDVDQEEMLALARLKARRGEKHARAKTAAS